MDVLDIAYRLEKVNVTQVLVKILKKPSTIKFVTGLNTEIQLFQDGEDSEGRKLSSIGGDYATSTIRIKRSKGQPTNRITLNDKGDLYDSFDITVKQNADFTITADTIKNGVDLQKRWGNKFVGLQNNNVVLVMEFLEIEFFKMIFRGL